MNRTCLVENCNNSINARGWCIKHYARWYKHGDPNTVADQSGSNNPRYKHGKYCKPSFCTCGTKKDIRSQQCAICSSKSFLIGKKQRASDDEIKDAVKNSKHYTGAAELLGVARGLVTRKVKELEIDTSHFQHGRGRPISTEQLLVVDSKVTRSTVRKRVYEENLLVYECSICGIEPLWNDAVLTLQLDHISGNTKDNRLENLRWLCPNCHSQTSTYTGRNTNERR